MWNSLIIRCVIMCRQIMKMEQNEHFFFSNFVTAYPSPSSDYCWHCGYKVKKKKTFKYGKICTKRSLTNKMKLFSHMCIDGTVSRVPHGIAVCFSFIFWKIVRMNCVAMSYLDFKFAWIERISHRKSILKNFLTTRESLYRERERVEILKLYSQLCMRNRIEFYWLIVYFNRSRKNN